MWFIADMFVTNYKQQTDSCGFNGCLSEILKQSRLHILLGAPYVTGGAKYLSNRPPPSTIPCEGHESWSVMHCGWVCLPTKNTTTPTGPTPTRAPVVPTSGHLARGSKALRRPNHCSQWATPLIQFYFISGERTTRGVGTFPGSCGPGVILSLNDPRSGSNCSLRDQLSFTRWENCVIVAGRETKTDIAHLLVG